MGKHTKTLTRSLAGAAAVALIAALALFQQPPARAGAMPDVQVDGGGWGHGLGMSQWGARGFAANGWSYDQILGHYYQGSAVSTIASPDTFRVGLTYDVGQVDGSTSGGGTAYCGSTTAAVPAGAFHYRIKSGSTSQILRSDGSEALSCGGSMALTYLPGTLTLAGHTYRHGYLELSVRPDAAAVRAILVIAADQGAAAIDVYLWGLGEMPSSWPAEALKTQAVAGRTYALEKVARLGQHRTSPACDCALLNGTSDQVYAGYDKEAGPSGAQWVAAVNATATKVSTYGGNLIQAYYHSSSGGATENNDFVWGGAPVPYLRGVSDPYDDTGGNPNGHWSIRFTWTDLQNRLNSSSATSVGTLTSIEIVPPTGGSGRVGSVLSNGTGGVRIVGSGGTKRVSGATIQTVLGLKSTLFRFTNLAPGDAKSVPAGGYTLRADGTLVAFGNATSATGLSALSQNVGRAVAVGGRGLDGYVLDGYGALHPFNGAPTITTSASWPTWDIARDLVLRADGRSGYVLDGWGALHPVGGAPAVTGGPDWSGQDIARRAALRLDGVSGYIVRTDGGVFPFGGAPTVATTAMPSGRTAVGLTLSGDGTQGYVALDDGSLLPFGTDTKPPAITGQLANTVGVDGRFDGTSGYLTAGDGTVQSFGGATASSATTGGVARRDVALIAEPTGYVLDGYGGVHSFGGAPTVTGAAYWPGWDIARRVLARPDGRGYVLDGWGGLHPFGTTTAAAPPAPSPAPYWGWDIAQDAVLLPGDGSSGYILDGYGGVHPFGAAPPARATGYWSGWNIARAIALNPSGTGGYVLDGFGGLHPFAVGDNPMPAAPSTSAYWNGWDIARGVAVTTTGQGYVIDGYGGSHPFGGLAAGAGSWYWGGHDLVAGAEGLPNGWAVYLDRWGGQHTAPEAAPAAPSGASWPGWSIARDVGLLRR